MTRHPAAGNTCATPPPPPCWRDAQLLTGDLSWDPDTAATNRYVVATVNMAETPVALTAYTDEWPRKGEDTNARGHLIASAMAFRGVVHDEQAEATFTFRNCVPSYQTWDGKTWNSAEVAAMNIQAKCWGGANSKAAAFFDVEVYYMAGPGTSAYGYLATDAAIAQWGTRTGDERNAQWSDLAPFPKHMWGLVAVVVKLKGSSTVLRTATLGWKCAITSTSIAATTDDAHPCALVSTSALSQELGITLLPGVDDTVETNTDNAQILPLAADCDAVPGGAGKVQQCKKGLNSLPLACKSSDASKALFARAPIKAGQPFTLIN
jgi:hypothetical protein